MIVVDRSTGEIRALIGSAKTKFNSDNRSLKVCRSIDSLSKPVTYLTALSQPNQYYLNTWISDEPISTKLNNGKYWITQNNNYHFSGKAVLLDSSMQLINISTVNLSMKIGIKKLVNIWKHFDIYKNQLALFLSISLGDINLIQIKTVEVFQTIASSGYKTLLKSVRSMVSNKGKILHQNVPQSQYLESLKASYFTLYVM
ncbi:hypothetical protein [Buchnera aphidicola]|uniref:hypothetical protein n=1 Tax=Buchnera aphidicola TaxID=9 RepID=UPI0021C77801|nr:hypothetical protein [Buchnera aphidicola]